MPPRNTSQPIELRAAREQDDEFFYVGLSLFPGQEALAASLRNRKLYHPHQTYSNEDQSITLEWQQANLGNNKRERKQNFFKYVADLVVPQLARATDQEVDFDGELKLVHLQLTETKSTDNPEKLKVVRTQLGSMSLFTPAIEPELVK